MKSLISFIVIGICVGMYFLYVNPEVDEVKSLISRKTEYADVLAKSKEINDKRIVLDNQYNSISETDLSKLSKIIPDTFDAISFINNINSVALRNGMVIKDFKANNSNSAQTADRGSPDRTVVATNYITNSVTLSVFGRYSSFQKFLLDLESSLNLVDIVSLTMNPENTGKGTDDSFSYALTLQTYSLK